MNIEISEMTPKEILHAISLWKSCEGIGMSDDVDGQEPLTRFLHRNPGLSFVAKMNGELVGTCLCGHDGRRGFLYHLAVDPQARHLGIGKALVDRVFEGLRAQNIHKCHIMVFADNEGGLKFWKNTGWSLRPELVLMSRFVFSDQGGSPC